MRVVNFLGVMCVLVSDDLLRFLYTSFFWSSVCEELRAYFSGGISVFSTGGAVGLWSYGCLVGCFVGCSGGVSVLCGGAQVC